MNPSPSHAPDDPLYDVRTHAPGPAGSLPLQADWLQDTASGNVFGWTMDAAIPPLRFSGLIVAGGLIPLAGTDTVATSDGIIRNRRGYDNG